MAEKKSKYYKRPDGLYEAIRTVNGKRVAFRGKTCREVDKKILEYREAASRGWTFDFAGDLWYQDKEAEVRSATYRSYGITLRRLKERFGKQYVAEITPDELNAYIRAFERQGYARNTVQLHIYVLKMVFDYAINRRMESGLAINPAVALKKSKDLPFKKRGALTEEQEALVRNAAKTKTGDWWLLGFFLMYSGCRRGEALALTYSDIDRKRNVITVNKKLNFDGRSTPILENFTKTKNGMREIPLLKPLADALPRDRIGLVFPSPETGDYLKTSEVAKYWKQYCRDVGLVEVVNGKERFPITPHCFRHSFATICYEAGIDPRAAASWLGDTVQVMEGVYIDLRGAHKEGATSALQSFVSMKESAAK